jgi:hypothetical protein
VKTKFQKFCQTHPKSLIYSFISLIFHSVIELLLDLLMHYNMYTQISVAETHRGDPRAGAPGKKKNLSICLENFVTALTKKKKV